MDTDAVRLPLAIDLKTAINDPAIGERIFNAHTEARGGAQRVKKRRAGGWLRSSSETGYWDGRTRFVRPDSVVCVPCPCSCVCHCKRIIWLLP